jgi:hypothetical protein
MLNQALKSFPSGYLLNMFFDSFLTHISKLSQSTESFLSLRAKLLVFKRTSLTHLKKQWRMLALQGR